MANPHPIRKQAFFLRQKPRSWMESSSGIHSLLLKRWAVTSVLTCPLGLLLSGVLFPTQPSVAQLIPDGSTGTQIQSGALVEGLPSDLIEGGTVRDSNLFHSFQDFNVEGGRGVYFNPQNGILTILTRVTGGNISNIDGTLGVFGSADLFLLNPTGIVFGPNAQLDISGSFVGSTAESIFFENYEFSAADTNTPPLLTLSVPLGLRMGTNPGSLEVNQTTLSVDQALTLAAGVLDVSGDLQAGGDITLRGQERRLAEGSFTTGGYVFTQDLNGTNVDFLIPHENVIRAVGDVQLSDDYTGPSLYVLAGGQVTVGDGTGSVEITDAGGASVTATIADGIGGTQAVTVNAMGEPTLDIRAGVDWSQLPGGAPGNENRSDAQVVFGNETGTSGATSASILTGEIVNTGGRVALSNLFSPNEALAGAIQLEVIDTSTSIDAVSSPQTGPVIGTDGGDILISGRGDVVTEELISRSDIVLADEDGNASDRDVIGGNGGDILITTLGDVTASLIAALSFTINDSGTSVAGDGGDITLSSINGDITVTDRLGSPSYLQVIEGDVTGGTG
ncbi:MAG: filamentous hemagglutinin N-terminal domain-containing protein, partial [Leptolyngbya sp. SIO3F4]|nr:filamentous hemagglutinin N-terminal domain-containing protein [Leptolyngbya sp. SIO3F4]